MKGAREAQVMILASCQKPKVDAFFDAGVCIDGYTIEKGHTRRSMAGKIIIRREALPADLIIVASTIEA